MSFGIGSIQGRLLPALDGQIQAFPCGRWQEEFQRLNAIGYDAIELVIDTASWEEHPLNTVTGRARLASLSRAWNIALRGICCDVFMDTPLVATDESISHRADSLLREILRHSGELGLPFIELPFVGSNALADSAAIARLASVLEWALPLAEEANLEILLETNLGPPALVEIMRQLRHPRLKLNYDTGNSTWFGFDPSEELRAYHHDIRNIHIKDCTRENYSVPLGSGETRFDTIFGLLSELGYEGDFIIQAARQSDDVAAARQYFEFTANLVDTYLGHPSTR